MAADFPQWVRNLAEKHGGSQLRFVMEKTIEKSDLDRQQNCLHTPKQCVAYQIIPILHNYERIAANVIDIDAPLKKKTDDDAKKKKEAGRVHGALPIEIYDRAGWRFYSSLIRWDSSSTVLRSGEWITFAGWRGFKVGDRVEIGCFRVERADCALSLSRRLMVELL